MAPLLRQLSHYLLLSAAIEVVAVNHVGEAVSERSAVDENQQSYSRYRRSTDAAPNGYVPSRINCPSSRPSIRKGGSLSAQEKEWLPKRRNATIEPIREFIGRLGIPGFDSEKYLKDVETNAAALPNIGLAISGGGYRAMLTGAGALAAWDIRSTENDGEGNLGGLLQSATYLSGLSGGGWLVGSLYANNFTSVQASLDDATVWQFGSFILDGPEQYSLLAYYQDIFDSVSDKKDAGYETTITDYWARMLSYQLVNATDGGPGYTFSSIAEDAQFSSGQAPLPILVADGRYPNEKIVSLNSTVYEFNPWELGTSDPTVNGYVPLKYVGSEFEAGKLANSSACIAGFDNAGFVMGTSSSLFNQFVLYLNTSDGSLPKDVPHFAIDTLSKILGRLDRNGEDIAEWTPNPFYKWNEKTNPGAENKTLTLVDGGEDLQNIPYHPHLLPDRKVDVVFSIDSSADTNSTWPDGASATYTYKRSLSSIAGDSSFPVVPGQSTFLNKGFNMRPTFFGCNATNTTRESPLIVYIPNYPYVFYSNITTFTLSLNDSERNAMVQNGWAVATQLNGTRDKDWPRCVGCAALHRSFLRTNTSLPKICETCFDRYCWDGKVDESKPASYNPRMYSTPLDISSGGWKERLASLFVMVLGLVIAL